MLRRFTGLLIFLIVIASFPSIARACTPPEIPSCFSSQGLTSGRPDYNFCRGQITYYEDYGKNYLDCLRADANRSAEEANRAAQDYNRNKSEFETARRNLNEAVNRLNQANAKHQQQRQNYQNASQSIQQNLNAIISAFNQMVGR